MKLLVIYRPNSEHGRSVEAFIQNFQERHEEVKLEILNIDSRDGNAAASLYDVTQYPSLLAVREDGTLLRSWEGATLPLIDDVAYYTMGNA